MQRKAKTQAKEEGEAAVKVEVRAARPSPDTIQAQKNKRFKGEEKPLAKFEESKKMAPVDNKQTGSDDKILPDDLQERTHTKGVIVRKVDRIVEATETHYKGGPDKPLTAYNLFVKKGMKKMMDEQHISMCDASKKMSLEWKEVSEELKKQYEQQAAEEKQLYKQQKTQLEVEGFYTKKDGTRADVEKEEVVKLIRTQVVLKDRSVQTLITRKPDATSVPKQPLSKSAERTKSPSPPPVMGATPSSPSNKPVRPAVKNESPTKRSDSPLKSIKVTKIKNEEESKAAPAKNSPSAAVARKERSVSPKPQAAASSRVVKKVDAPSAAADVKSQSPPAAKRNASGVVKPGKKV